MPIIILKIGFSGLCEGVEQVDRQTRVGTYKLGPWCYHSPIKINSCL